MAQKDNSQFSWIRDRITPSLLIACVGLLIKLVIVADSRTFDTEYDKVNTKNLVDAVSIEQIKKLANHVDAPEIHQNMETKDSLFVTEKEYQVILNMVGKVFDDVNEINTKIYVQGRILKRIEDKIDPK